MKAERQSRPTKKGGFQNGIQKRKAKRRNNRKRKKENRALFANRGKFRPSVSNSDSKRSGPSNKIKHLQAFAEEEKRRLREGVLDKVAAKKGGQKRGGEAQAALSKGAGKKGDHKPGKVDEEPNQGGFQMVTSNSDRLARLQAFVNAEARKMGVTDDEGKTTSNQKHKGDDSKTGEKKSLIRDKRRLQELREGQKQDSKEIKKLASLLRLKASRKKVSPIFADDFGGLLQDIEEGNMSHKKEYADIDDELNKSTSGFDKDLAVVLGHSSNDDRNIKSKELALKDKVILDNELEDFEMGCDDSGVDEDASTEVEQEEEGNRGSEDENFYDSGDDSDESEKDAEISHCGLIDSEAEVDNELEESEDDGPPREDSVLNYQLLFEGGDIMASGKQEDIDLYSSDSQDDEDLEGFVVNDDIVEYESSSEGDSILDDKFDDSQGNCKSENGDSDSDVSLKLKRTKKRKSLRISDGDEGFEVQEKRIQVEVSKELAKDLAAKEQDVLLRSIVKEEVVGEHIGELCDSDNLKKDANNEIEKPDNQVLIDVDGKTCDTERTDNKGENVELKVKKKKKKRKKTTDDMTENEEKLEAIGSEKFKCNISNEKENKMLTTTSASKIEVDENQDFIASVKKNKEKGEEDAVVSDEQNPELTKKKKKKKKKTADDMLEKEDKMEAIGGDKSEYNIGNEKVKSKKEMLTTTSAASTGADENQDLIAPKKKKKKNKEKGKEDVGVGDEQNSSGNVEMIVNEKSFTKTVEAVECIEIRKDEEVVDQGNNQGKKKKKSVTFSITEVAEEEVLAKDIVQNKTGKKKKKTSVLKACQIVDDESNKCDEEIEKSMVQIGDGNIKQLEDIMSRKRRLSEESSENEGTQKRKKKRKRRKMVDPEAGAEDVCEEELLQEADNGTSFDEINNIENLGQDTETCNSRLTMDNNDIVKSEDLCEDIYGRLRDKEGNVVKDGPAVQPGGKYVPPALRKLMALDSSEQKKERLIRLRRQLKGLFNRVAESNMAGIANMIESMYLNNSRNDLNETLTDLFMESLVTPVITPERLTQEHSLLLAVLSANVGSEVGMHVLNDFVLKWNDLVEEGTSEESSKELDNLLMFVCHLYNFKVVSAQLIYDILNKLAASFRDKEVELILLVLRSVGFTLRKDDPIALKLLITKIQNQAHQISKENQEHSYSRVKFMLEVVQAIKNNNMAKVPNYDPSHVEHLKKVLRGLIHKGKQLVELKVSLDDLLKSRERGRWWIVGSAWTGEMDTDMKKVADVTPLQATKGQTEYSEKFLRRAAKLRMSRPPRVNILYILTEGSHDFLDAFEKLLQLSLPSSQEQEIFNVIMICCLRGKQYNPFYSYLAEKMCQFDKKYKRLAQFALWDKFQGISELKEREVTNLAKFVSHLVADDALNLSVLKKISFMDADVRCISFLRQLLLSILLHPTGTDTVERVFSHLTVSPKLKTLRLSLRVFMLKFLKSKSDADDEDHQLLAKHTNIALDLISSGIGAQL